MKKDLIIHIGLHKTGSSFLQHCVFPKIKGINYIYKPENPLFVPILASRKNLMSDEEISRSMPHKDNTFKIINKLHKTYPNAKIIVGIRDCRSWFKSCYAQYVKTGGSMMINEYYAAHCHSMMIPTSYALRLRAMWKNVFVYTHEDLITHPYDVVCSMCRFMGVEEPEYTVRKINVSLKGSQVETWRKINKVFHGEWLREHIESPWWIWTFAMRRLKKEYRVEK